MALSLLATLYVSLTRAGNNMRWAGTRLYLISTVLVIYSVIAISASATESYPRKINFLNIMQNEDFALGEVEAILQDHQGFMWLGGRNGLMRYDGYEFLAISATNNPRESTQVSTVRQVIELLEDSQRGLWVASGMGLYRYDHSHEILRPIIDSKGVLHLRESIISLAESPKGEILVGTRNGLFMINFHPKKHMESQVAGVSNQSGVKGLYPDITAVDLPGKIVNDLFVDQKGMVWIGLDEGLLQMDWSSRTQKMFIPDPDNPHSLVNNAIKTIAEDHHGDIWFGSDNGTYRLDVTTGKIKIYRHDPNNPHSLTNNFTRNIYVDRQGWVWIGSDQGGISLYDRINDHFINFKHEDGRTGNLSSNTVRRIYEDNIGDVWIGTYPSGVNIYNRSTSAFTVFKKEMDLSQGLLSNNVEAVEVDKQGNLWIGAGGVSRYDPHLDKLTHYPYTGASDSPSESPTVLNGLIDSEGDIRFGSWAHGMLLYNRESDRFEKVAADPDINKKAKETGELLNDLMIWSVYEDHQNILWLGTHYNGITSFDKKTGMYTYYPSDPNNPEAISNAIAWTTYEDSYNRLWVGTAYGLNLMDRKQGTFKRYFPDPDKPRHLANGSVLCIYEDSQRRLWLGTDAGLHRYHSETDDFSIYGIKDGFFNEGIRAILEDKKGNLWLGTNNGIVMYNPDTRIVRNYTRHNGELIGGVATGSAAVTPAGEMAFGTRNGLYIIDPGKLLINQQPPSIALTDFRIFTEKVAIGGPENILTASINQVQSITLDYKKSMISFSFAALNFRDSDKNQYAYKLEGFDDKWREVGNQRTALYTNLPARTYTFRVKASNNDGIWNTEGRSISLTILPPPWKTWWAYSLYILVGMGLLAFYAYMQHRKIQIERKNSRELEIKVAERTLELRNKNEELEQAYSQLETVSLSDPLTGINNRRYLQKIMPKDTAMVQREYRNSSADGSDNKNLLDITFFILDVDYFKSVNDINGHAAGDKLLVDLSSLLIKVSRESDCVIRWGGEEFLIVSRFAPRREAHLMAERIREYIERYEFELPDGKRLKKTCSIGFASYPFFRDRPECFTWEQVVDIADHALYSAKKSGRNRCVGLAANNATNPETLVLGLNSNLKALVHNAELEVISDKPEELIWD